MSNPEEEGSAWAFVSPAVMESIEDYAGQGRLEWILSRVRVYKMPTPRDFHREREQWSTR